MSKHKSKRTLRREERRARLKPQLEAETKAAAMEKAVRELKAQTDAMLICLAKGHVWQDTGEVFATCKRCQGTSTEPVRLMPAPMPQQNAPQPSANNLKLRFVRRPTPNNKR